MKLIINDLPITGPYCVYAVNLGQYIWQWLDTSAPGDIPPDVAILPVVGLRSVCSGSVSVLYIDTIA